MPRKVFVIDSEAYERLCQPAETPQASVAQASTQTPAASAPAEPAPAEPWLKGIPSRFHSTATETKKRLEELFHVKDNVLIFEEEALDLATVLKALCVPFTKTGLPQRFKEALRQHGVKCRNHLALRPEWRAFLRF